MRPLLFVAALFSLLTSAVNAGEKPMIQYDPPVPQAPVRSVFEKGRIEYQSLWQGYTSFGAGGGEPTINLLMSTYRLGYMLNEPQGETLWRGNYEILVEGLYGSVLKGPGDYVAGGNLILRRNFVPKGDERWTYYAQVGAGVVWNDMYKGPNQSQVGQSKEYSLLGAAGVRYQFKPKWNFSGEVGYRLLSNAGEADRDAGLHSVGIGLGFGYSF